jgi:hypothetical protein
MSIKRRQFLILSSLSGLGLAVLAKIFRVEDCSSTLSIRLTPLTLPQNQQPLPQQTPYAIQQEGNPYCALSLWQIQARVQQGNMQWRGR